MRLKIDWASFKVESKFTVFALFYFVLEDNFPSTSPRGAHTWRGFFSEFYGTSLETSKTLTKITTFLEKLNVKVKPLVLQN